METNKGISPRSRFWGPPLMDTYGHHPGRSYYMICIYRIIYRYRWVIIYIYIYIHLHVHTYIYIYIYIHLSYVDMDTSMSFDAKSRGWKPVIVRAQSELGRSQEGRDSEDEDGEKVQEAENHPAFKTLVIYTVLYIIHILICILWIYDICMVIHTNIYV